jgi:phosphopantothenoylcysteine synthetase/decarboxylase
MNGQTGNRDEGRPVLYIIACGSPAARFVPSLVQTLRDSGWTVCVVTSPDGRKFVDVNLLEELTGYPVRSEYKHPEEPDVLPAADVVVAYPATFNTLNKWVLGISDTLAVGLLCEYTGLGKPVVAVPCVGTNSGLDTHPAFQRSLTTLAELGVHIVYDRATYSMDDPNLADTVAARIDEISSEVARS